MSRQNPITVPVSAGLEVATLGGGCFWCLEAVYEQVAGVVDVESGYCNGHVVNPSYEQVCGKDTGHAEVVRISFDPQQISFTQLLEIFYGIHDPTTLNRQGNDVGPQYRSGIYVHSAEQERVAREFVAQTAGDFDEPIVTEILPEQNYWRAEQYHQEYFRHNPYQGYCMAVVGPKVRKFTQAFARYRRPV